METSLGDRFHYIYGVDCFVVAQLIQTLNFLEVRHGNLSPPVKGIISTIGLAFRPDRNCSIHRKAFSSADRCPTNQRTFLYSFTSQFLCEAVRNDADWAAAVDALDNALRGPVVS